MYKVYVIYNIKRNICFNFSTELKQKILIYNIQAFYNMLIITLNTLDDSKYTPLGLVRGTIVHSVSFFRDIIGNLTGLLGGKNSAINKKIDDVYAEAISELEAYTKRTYPNATAISGVEISLTEMREFIICVATGTAVVESSKRQPNPAPAPAPVPVQKLNQNPNQYPNQILKSTAIAPIGGSMKSKTKRVSHNSHKSRKHRR
jgi:uncharacterized protein YbjQ (UPF0145 family)